MEDTRLAGSTASRPKQRICPGWSARLDGSAGSAGRVCRHDGPGRAWRAGSGGTADRVGGHGGPGRGGTAGLVGGLGWQGRLAWLAESPEWSWEGRQKRAWWCCRSGPGGAVGAGRVGQDRAGPGRSRLPAVNLPMNGFLRCVCLRSWHVG